jgi:hypothetical protein
MLSVESQPMLLSQSQGHGVPKRIRSIEKPSDFTENQAIDLLACSIVPQPAVPLHVSKQCKKLEKWRQGGSSACVGYIYIKNVNVPSCCSICCMPETPIIFAVY